jgi:regulator of protease activity HflC (stomatin/prohibitin superfamily)
MITTSKRPEHLAWASLISSLVLFGVAFFLGRWSGFTAVWVVSWQILAAALIWFVLAVQFHQRSLAEQEKLDMRQLAEGHSSATIFQGKGEQAALLAAAQRRLELLEKWFVPIFAVLIAAYEIGIGIYLLKVLESSTGPKTQQPLVCAIVMTAVAFASFLFSRYATGMSAETPWKPLRAGGSYTLGVALACFALAIGLAATYFHYQSPALVIGYVVAALLILLGVETTLNALLDIYRPRLKGQYNRSAFDSRLLGIINEPGGIFRSAAGAIDYQFGFQVSQTWFYKLLEKAIVPLILFSAATLYLASCIVVVGPDEQAIVEHFGNPRNTDGGTRVLESGLHFKWPWPIDIAYKYPTQQVHEIYVGYVPRTDPKTGRIIPEPSLLWGQTHYQQEDSVLVASESSTSQPSDGAVPVSLIKANIPVQYRIKDLYSYVYQHREPAKLLEDICYRELTQFAAGAKLEADEGSGANVGLLGGGRSHARDTLVRRIQDAADKEGLGVKIVFLGLQGIHPPPEVASDYEAVIGAVQERQTEVLRAEAERNRTLGTLIGTVQMANELYGLAQQYRSAEYEGKADEVERIGKQFDAAFERASGDVFKVLREAQSYRFEKAALAKAAGDRFAGQIKAYRAAPRIYVQQQRLAALEEALKDIRKYVVMADPNDTHVLIMDLQDKPPSSLTQMGQALENNPR